MHLGVVTAFEQRQYFADQCLALGRVDPGLQQAGIGEAHHGGEMQPAVVRADDVDVQVPRLAARSADRALEPCFVGRQRSGANLVLDDQGHDVAVVLGCGVHRRSLG
ncbi:hypothetical protein D3C80_1795210 [compost metagenome]